MHAIVTPAPSVRPASFCHPLPTLERFHWFHFGQAWKTVVDRHQQLLTTTHSFITASVASDRLGAMLIVPSANGDRPHDTVWWRGVSADGPHDGINIETTRCRLLCHDLDCGTVFFWRRFGLLSTFFDLLWCMWITTTKTISGKLLAISFAATMQPLSNYFDFLIDWHHCR